MILGFFSISVLVPGQCSEYSFVGTDFYFMVLETSAAVRRDVNVFVTNHETSSNTIQVDTPTQTGIEAFGTSSTRIPPRSSKILTIPISLFASGSQKELKGIRIRSFNGDISVSILNRQDDGCGAYKILPYPALGFNYYTLSVWPPTPPITVNNQIGIVATEDNSAVTITVPPGSGIRFVYDNTEYNDNAGSNELQVTLQQYETLQLQDTVSADMSRIKVSSPKRIAVFVGIQKVDIGLPDDHVDPATDSIIEQMPPLHAYGSKFALVPFPNNARYTYQILAREDQTQITHDRRVSTIRTAPGLLYSRPEEAGKPLFVDSNKPILVAMIHPSRDFENEGGPSIVIVPPVEQYKSEYIFTAPYKISGTPYENFIMITIEKGKESGLRMNNLALTSATWEDIPESNPPMVGASFAVIGQTRRLHNVNGDRFGAYMYGYESNTNCRYALSVGQCLDDIRAVSTFKTLSIEQIHFTVYILCPDILLFNALGLLQRVVTVKRSEVPCPLEETYNMKPYHTRRALSYVCFQHILTIDWIV